MLIKRGGVWRPVPSEAKGGREGARHSLLSTYCLHFAENASSVKPLDQLPYTPAVRADAPPGPPIYARRPPARIFVDAGRGVGKQRSVVRHGVRRLEAVSRADADDAHAGAGAFALPRVACCYCCCCSARGCSGRCCIATRCAVLLARSAARAHSPSCSPSPAPHYAPRRSTSALTPP
mgnify:CR=1 FL=1